MNIDPHLLIRIEQFFKWLLLSSILVMAIAYLQKDKLPDVSFYDVGELQDPLQHAINEKPFATVVNDIAYAIAPKYDYELNGVVVSYHNADDISDIWHHRVWKDFLNTRDLCVVWGSNIASGVYLDAAFHNDSWTCWAYWPDYSTRDRFRMNQLSNNHLLADDPYINRLIMEAEVGDQVRFQGRLAGYKNLETGAYRGTSTTRTDTGNGACETVYVEDFEIVRKANPGWRNLYGAAKYLALISLVGFVVMLFLAPVRKGL
jgi:hypothetical protein